MLHGLTAQGPRRSSALILVRQLGQAVRLGPCSALTAACVVVLLGLTAESVQPVVRGPLRGWSSRFLAWERVMLHGPTAKGPLRSSDVAGVRPLGQVVPQGSPCTLR